MAFRSIGWLDTWFGSMQSPVDLFEVEPWWQKLSFHDHPPLTFFVEHVFFLALGSTAFALRLPFVLAGLGAVVLAYLLGRELRDERYGLLAAAIMAAANYPVWMSRVGFQEGLLTVWVLLALWLFARSLKNPRYVLGVGAAVGLALLTKYSAVVLIPVILGGYLFFQPRMFRSARTYAALAVMLAVLSPAIVYNAMLFAERGHFDATLWAMLGNRHADFSTDAHSYSSGLTAFQWLHWLPDGFGWLLLFFAIAGLVLLVLFREPADAGADFKSSKFARFFLVVFSGSVVGFLSLAPGRKQYAALAAVPVVFLAAWALAHISGRRKTVMVTGVIVALALVTANTQLFVVPLGTPGLGYLPLRPTSYVYQALDRYLDELYQGRPMVVQLTHIAQVDQRYGTPKPNAVGTKSPATLPPLLVVWDERMDFAAVRWLILRRRVYQHQPSISASNLSNLLSKSSPTQSGLNAFKDFRYIFIEPWLLAESGALGHNFEASNLRMYFAYRGQHPDVVVKDAQGRGSFSIYRTAELPWGSGEATSNTAEIIP